MAAVVECLITHLNKGEHRPPWTSRHLCCWGAYRLLDTWTPESNWEADPPSLVKQYYLTIPSPAPGSRSGTAVIASRSLRDSGGKLRPDLLRGICPHHHYPQTRGYVAGGQSHNIPPHHPGESSSTAANHSHLWRALASWSECPGLCLCQSSCLIQSASVATLWVHWKTSGSDTWTFFSGFTTQTTALRNKTASSLTVAAPSLIRPIIIIINMIYYSYYYGIWTMWSTVHILLNKIQISVKKSMRENMIGY